MNDILANLVASWREDLGPDADAGTLTDRVLDTVITMEPWQVRELLRPLVIPWVRKHESERARVRAAEARAFSPRAGSAVPNPAELAMRKLLSERCFVPGHGLVPWGTMTAEFHRLRIGYLSEQLRRITDGTKAAIKRHEFTIGLLKESGCPDLDEYARRYGGLPETLTEAGEAVVATA